MYEGNMKTVITEKELRQRGTRNSTKIIMKSNHVKIFICKSPGIFKICYERIPVKA